MSNFRIILLTMVIIIKTLFHIPWITILVLMTLNSMSTISANFTNFDLDESDGDTSTHLGTSTVIQTTSQLEDDRLLSQNIAPKSAREDGQRAQRASSHARRGRNTPRPTSLRSEALQALFKDSKHDIPWLYSLV
jgi:hypothetical protein